MRTKRRYFTRDHIANANLAMIRKTPVDFSKMPIRIANIIRFNKPSESEIRAAFADALRAVCTKKDEAI